MKLIQNKGIRYTLKVFLITIISLNNIAPVFGQNMDSLKNELQKVSLTMYKNHDRNFIIVDAIIDGFMQINAKTYSFSYANDVVIINNHKLDDVYNMIYVNKIKNFFSWSREGPGVGFSMTYNTPITLVDIFNTSSYFRKQYNPASTETQEKYRQLVNMLASDKLIDTSRYYIIIYKPEGLFLNNKRLEDMFALKYLAFINKELGATRQSDMFMIDKTHVIPVTR